MSSDSVCRLCLAIDVAVRDIAASPLQEVYEKLTNVSLNTCDKPMVACSFCYWQLRKCHKLMTRSLRADELLTKILQTGVSIKRESICMIDNAYKLHNTLSISPIKIDTYIDSEYETGNNIRARSPNIREIEHVANIKKENLEESSDEGNVYEKRVRDVKPEILVDISEIKIEFADDELEDAGPDMKCDIQQSTQDTTAVQLQNNTRQTDDKHPHRRDKSLYIDRNATDLTIRANRPRRNSSCGDSHANKFRLGKSATEKKIYFKKGSVRPNELINSCESTNNPIYNRQELEKDTSTCDKSEKVSLKNIATHSKNPYVCSLCGKAFKQKNTLKIHLRFHSGEQPYECSQCGRKFTYRGILKYHLRRHAEEKNLQHQCTICDRKFKKKGSLENHLVLHGEKPFACTKCDKAFKQKISLNIHFRTHSGEKPFECDICHSKFKNKCNLTYHLNMHTGEKPFECPICHRTFNVKSSLKVHLKTHSDDDQYQCTICFKSFKQERYLRVHFKLHSSEKRFECDVCNRTFKQKCHVLTHLRTHSLDRPFKCQFCEKSFQQQRYLRIHMRTHPDKKPI